LFDESNDWGASGSGICLTQTTIFMERNLGHRQRD
jgi:hypothetical protein